MVAGHLAAELCVVDEFPLRLVEQLDRGGDDAEEDAALAGRVRPRPWACKRPEQIVYTYEARRGRSVATGLRGSRASTQPPDDGLPVVPRYRVDVEISSSFPAGDRPELGDVHLDEQHA